MAKTRKGRSNPGAQSAKDMAEKFHGRAITEVIDIEEIEHEPSNLAVIGKLVELRVVPVGEEKYEYPISFKGCKVFAACDGDGRQIYFVGGEQGIEDLLEQIGVEAKQRFVVAGYCSGIVYRTDKAHLVDSSGEGVIDDYDHEFGEQGGHWPTLIYDCCNKHLHLAGGTYEVRDVGIWN